MTRRYPRHVRVEIDTAATITKIEELFIRFDLRLDGSDVPPDGIIDVLNLADGTETRFRKRGENIRLWAGYGPDPPMIFNGAIRRVERKREGMDRVTRFYVGGAVNEIGKGGGSIFTRTYAKVTLRQILTDIVGVMQDVTIGALNIIPLGIELEDVAHDGPAKHYLSARLKPFGFEWYEDSGVIKFRKIPAAGQAGAAGPAGTPPSIVISEETGMIGSPTLTDEGVRVTTLLDHRLKPAVAFKIESDYVLAYERGVEVSTDTYTAVMVGHHGDNWTGPFYTDVDGKPIS